MFSQLYILCTKNTGHQNLNCTFCRCNPDVKKSYESVKSDLCTRYKNNESVIDILKSLPRTEFRKALTEENIFFWMGVSLGINGQKDINSAVIKEVLDHAFEVFDECIKHHVKERRNFMRNVFPLTGLLKDTDIAEKMYHAEDDKTALLAAETRGEDETRIQDESKRHTALSLACALGNIRMVRFLVNKINTLSKHCVRKAVMRKDVEGKTCLHLACEMEDNTECIRELLVNLDHDIKHELILQQDKNLRTALHYACCLGHWEHEDAQLKGIPEDIKQKLLNTKDRDGKTPLSHKATKRREVFIKACRDGKNQCIRSVSIEMTLAELLDNIDKENLIPTLDKAAHLTLCQSILLHDSIEKLSSKKTPFLEGPKVLKVLCQKNKVGCSGFEYDENLEDIIKLLDLCAKENISFDDQLETCFPTFCEHYKLRKDERAPFTEVYHTNVLTVIGQTTNVLILKHPYLQAYIQLCWHAFARYIFYADLFRFFLFFIALSVFVSCQQLVPLDRIQVNETAHDFTTSVPAYEESLQSSVPVLSEICRYFVILLCCLGLGYEGLQIYTWRSEYFKLWENYLEIFLFVGSLFVTIHSLSVGYTTSIHGISGILLVLGAVRGAEILSNAPLVQNIGFRFKMLLSVAYTVCNFLPILIFFLAIFAMVFHNFLKNQDPFSHFGYSFIKIMVMTIGEFDFSEVFFHKTNINIFEDMALVIFIVFLIIMTISMTNLLIGYATGDFLDKLIRQAEHLLFKSKLRLILQYSYLFWGFGSKKHGMLLFKLRNITCNDVKCEDRKESCQHVQKQWKTYMEKLNREYKLTAGEIGMNLRTVNDNVNRRLDKLLDRYENISQKVGRLTSAVDSLKTVRSTQEQILRNIASIKMDLKVMEASRAEEDHYKERRETHR